MGLPKRGKFRGLMYSGTNPTTERYNALEHISMMRFPWFRRAMEAMQERQRRINRRHNLTAFLANLVIEDYPNIKTKKHIGTVHFYNGTTLREMRAKNGVGRRRPPLQVEKKDAREKIV